MIERFFRTFKSRDNDNSRVCVWCTVYVTNETGKNRIGAIVGRLFDRRGGVSGGTGWAAKNRRGRVK